MKIVEQVTIGAIILGIFVLMWVDILFPESTMVLPLIAIAILFSCFLAIMVMLRESEEKEV